MCLRNSMRNFVIHFGFLLRNHAGRVLTNLFIMAVYENFFQVQSEISIQRTTEKTTIIGLIMDPYSSCRMLGFCTEQKFWLLLSKHTHTFMQDNTADSSLRWPKLVIVYLNRIVHCSVIDIHRNINSCIHQLRFDKCVDIHGWSTHTHWYLKVTIKWSIKSTLCIRKISVIVKNGMNSALFSSL